MPISINLTNDEIKKAQGGFEPLAEGTYGAVIYGAKVDRSKNSGNLMYVIDYKITEGPEGKGRKLKSWYTLAPHALFSVIGLLKATGNPYPTKETPEGEFEFPDADEFIGEEVNIKIVKEPYETVDDEGNNVTRERNNVKNVYPYNADKISSEDDVADADNSGVFL